jgi:hypothetical protein
MAALWLVGYGWDPDQGRNTEKNCTVEAIARVYEVKVSNPERKVK